MRPLKTLLELLLSLLVVLQTAQAKIPYAYVANNAANTVTVIDTGSGAVVKTIAVGSFPYGVAVDQAGKFVYVTNSGSNTVSVISTTTNAVVATITLTGLSGPMDIALTPNGKTAYVSCGNSNAVAVINTATKTFKTIAVQNPIGLAVTPTGAFVYAVSSGPGNVLVISTLTNAVVATIPVGTNIPIGVVISPDGTTAYVTNYNAHTVIVIQTGNNVISNTINVSAGPFHEAVSPDGHWLYVANYNAGGGNLVTAIDTSTQTVTGTVVVGTGPIGLAFTQDSAFVGVTNEGSNNVSVIDTASRTVTRTITVGTGPIGGAILGPQKVSTVVGGYVGDGGLPTLASIEGPGATVQDKAGNVYISDIYGNRIRKVDPTGTKITTYAGNGVCGYNGDGMASTKATICIPSGITLDAGGNFIVADQGNARIRKITVAGTISTIAGNGSSGYSGDGGMATKAAIGSPFYPAYDSSGNLYFSQVGNCVVRKVDTSGTITTVAGTGTCGYNGDGILATTAQLNGPRGLAFDASGNMYITDTNNHRIRIVTPAGTINTFAGTGQNGFSGDGGLATKARIGMPRTVQVQNGVLYIARGGQQSFRQVNLSTNIITTYAGSTVGYDGDNHGLLSTLFNGSVDMRIDSSGNPIFDDALNGRVRKATGGIVNTIAGGFLGDGNKATSAALVFPEAIAIDKSGNFYIADYAGNRVRKVSVGKISTVAGTGVSGFSGDGLAGTSAMLYAPQGVAVDSTGNVFIADTFNGRIRKVDTAGTISTFATNASFSDLLQMASDSANNLYVADDGVCVVWKITPAAVVSIVAGVLNTCGYNGDGIAATAAQLNGPSAVAVDAGGNLFLVDYGNNRVRQVNTSGIIGTIAGNGTCNYTGDGGSATTAELCPWGIAVNKSGTIYVSDLFFGRIREIRGGTITTFAGAGFGFNGDGLWPLYTMFDDPVALAVDSKGAVYELDDLDHRLRKIQ
jgi:YVTN family beta-propeller protein